MPDLKDAYGNYQAGLSPGPSLPGSYGTLRHGSGAPDAGLGDDGDGYIDVANGDFYSKKTTGWELQSGVGGAAVTPTGVVDPEGVETAVVGTFYVNTADKTLWFKETGSGNTGWVQYV